MTHAYDGEPAPRILVVDDQPAICFTLQLILEHYGYAVAVATNQVQAFMLMVRDAFDLLLVEPRLFQALVGGELMHFVEEQQPGATLALLAEPNGVGRPGYTTAPDGLIQIDKTASPPAIATGVAMALAQRGWASQRAVGGASQAADWPAAAYPQQSVSGARGKDR